MVGECTFLESLVLPPPIIGSITRELENLGLIYEKARVSERGNPEPAANSRLNSPRATSVNHRILSPTYT